MDNVNCNKKIVVVSAKGIYSAFTEVNATEIPTEGSPVGLPLPSFSTEGTPFTQLIHKS